MSEDHHAQGTGPTVVVTKLRPPRIRAAAPPRERLLRHVDDLGLRVVVVAAPAGFGKSTLLAHWAARTRRAVAWVSLDEGDNAVARFWLHLVESLRPVVPAFADRATAALRSPRTPSTDALATALVNALAEVDEGVLVVLDDYHVIDHPDLHAGVAFLVDHVPEGVTLVLASRTTPPLPFARLRGRGEMLELGSEPLRATLDEAAAFLTTGMGLALEAEAIERLLHRTEGWFAGLQLAALALRGREGDDGALLGFGADHRLVLEYLTEEVVRGLDAELQTFLLESSVLRRMTPSACDAVLGRDDGAAMLRRVDDANLFVFEVEGADGSYRYHALFQAWLRRRLQEDDPSRARELEARAGARCATEGDTEGAIRHLLAADELLQAAELVVAASVPALQAGRVEALRGWLAALPEAEVASRGRLALASAWCELVAGDLRGIDRWLEIAAAADLDAEAAAEAVALRAQVAGARGRTEDAVRLARVALESLGTGSPWVRGNLWLGLGSALHRAGEVAEAGEAFDAAAVAFDADPGRYGWLGAMQGVADTRRLQGSLGAAARTYRAMLRDGEGTGSPLPALGHAAIGLAKVALERFELDDAERMIGQGLAIGGTFERGVRIDGLLTLALLQRLRGAWDEADATLLTAARESRTHGFDRVVGRAATFRAALAMATGDLAEARRWRAGGGDPGEGAVRFEDHHEHATAIRLALAERDLEASGRRIAACSAEVERRGSLGQALELSVLRARWALLAGRPDEVEATLDSALARAAPEGYVRPFLMDGTELVPQLERCARRARDVGDAHAALVLASAPHRAATAAASAPGTGAGLAEPLTERERAVARLLAAGNSNKAVARALDVSVNTVKTHVRTIYGKLGVKSRAQLVVRVRDDQLLD